MGSSCCGLPPRPPKYTQAAVTQSQLERCDRQNELERLKQENQACTRRLEISLTEQDELCVEAATMVLQALYILTPSQTSEQRLASTKQTLEASRATVQELQMELAQYKVMGVLDRHLPSKLTPPPGHQWQYGRWSRPLHRGGGQAGCTGGGPDFHAQQIWSAAKEV
jgi:hypothetical protein